MLARTQISSSNCDVNNFDAVACVSNLRFNLTIDAQMFGLSSLVVRCGR